MLKTILTAALLLAGTPALAQQPGAASIRVSYAGLDLSSPAGIAEFDRRIARAVGAVCPTASGATLREHAATARCRDAARVAARDQRDVALAAAEQKAAIRIASARR